MSAATSASGSCSVVSVFGAARNSTWCAVMVCRERFSTARLLTRRAGLGREPGRPERWRIRARGSVKVGDLVLCVPGIGAMKVRLLLRELGIRETKRARELTVRQRRAISEAVGGASGGRPGTYPPGRPDGAAVIEQEVCVR